MATFTARQIMDTLAAAGFDPVWGNTGGGVYNVIVDVPSVNNGYCGTVCISDGGDWAVGDEDTPCESVTVAGYDLNGEAVTAYEPDWVQESTTLRLPDGTAVDYLESSYALPDSLPSVVLCVEAALDAVQSAFLDWAEETGSVTF